MGNALSNLIDEKRPELEALCRKHRVKTLEVFGSASDGRFDPRRSDLDFLVNSVPVEKVQIAPDYFGLLHDLEDLFLSSSSRRSPCANYEQVNLAACGDGAT